MSKINLVIILFILNMHFSRLSVQRFPKFGRDKKLQSLYLQKMEKVEEVYILFIQYGHDFGRRDPHKHKC